MLCTDFQRKPGMVRPRPVSLLDRISKSHFGAPPFPQQATTDVSCFQMRESEGEYMGGLEGGDYFLSRSRQLAFANASAGAAH